MDNQKRIEELKNSTMVDEYLTLIHEEEKRSYRNYMLENQFLVPRKLHDLSATYPEITWGQANELYRIAVENVLFKHKVECITDIPFGSGLVESKKVFEELLKVLSGRGE